MYMKSSNAKASKSHLGQKWDNDTEWMLSTHNICSSSTFTSHVLNPCLNPFRITSTYIETYALRPERNAHFKEKRQMFLEAFASELFIYKYTHIQYIYKIFTCLYLYLYNLYHKYFIYTKMLKYIHVCIYIINIHSTDMHYVNNLFYFGCD